MTNFLENARLVNQIKYGDGTTVTNYEVITLEHDVFQEYSFEEGYQKKFETIEHKAYLRVLVNRHITLYQEYDRLLMRYVTVKTKQN